MNGWKFLFPTEQEFNMSNLYNSKILKISDFYRKKILPSIGDVRGTTRPNIFLRNFGISQITEKDNDHYTINLTELESRKISDLDLLKKYVRIEYSQSCKIIEEIEKDTVFYDIGGFQGFHTILGTLGKKVYTFEPDPQNLEKLKKNVELNSDQDIEMIEKPVWNQVKELELDVGKEGESSVGEGEIKKKSTSLDNFVIEDGNSPPDLIKIDVEGAEQKVLEGAEKVLEKYKPEIMIEIHGEERLEKFESSEEEIDEILESKGYSLNKLENRGGEKHKFYV
jgi:FkbM family methyltransferase